MIFHVIAQWISGRIRKSTWFPGAGIVRYENSFKYILLFRRKNWSQPGIAELGVLVPGLVLSLVCPLFLKDSRFSFLSPPFVCFPSISFLYKYWISPLGVSLATCACNGGLFLLESLPVTVTHYCRKNCTSKLLQTFILSFFWGGEGGREGCKNSWFVHSYWEHLLPLLRCWELRAWILMLPPDHPVTSSVAKQNFNFSQLSCSCSLSDNFLTFCPSLCYWKTELASAYGRIWDCASLVQSLTTL